MEILLRDQLNRPLAISKKPTRIVSLVPSQTELLVALGLADFIVGITKFCVHPSHLLKTKKVVGGTKNVHYQKIDALQPHIILCNKEENTMEIVATLEKKYPVHVSDVASLSDTYQLIEAYGKLFSCEKKAREITKKISDAQHRFEAHMKNKPKINVLYLIWKNPWMAAGKGTFIDAILQLNHFQNALHTTTRYPELTEATIRAMHVDLILLSSEPFPFAQKHIAGIQQIAPKARIKLVDGEFFSWYGSRLIDAFPYFRSLH